MITVQIMTRKYFVIHLKTASLCLSPEALKDLRLKVSFA
jgi:hypothetical protein